MAVVDPVDSVLGADAVELIGAAALPIVEALCVPVAPRHVALAASVHLERLAALRELPRDTRLKAREALAAARGVLAESPAGERTAYGRLLRAMHDLLSRAGLPVPVELADGRI